MSKYNVYVEDVSIEALFNKLGGVRRVKRFLAGKLLLVEAMKPEPPSEPASDFIIRVDRSLRPSYPDWMKKLKHPNLECSGPAEYDLSSVELWFHDGQHSGSVDGNTIYKHLQKNNDLTSCLNLQDGLAIQQKGIAVFRNLFADKKVFLWGSVVQSRYSQLMVPYLYDNSYEVELNWFWLDYNWYLEYPALLFSK